MIVGLNPKRSEVLGLMQMLTGRQTDKPDSLLHLLTEPGDKNFKQFDLALHCLLRHVFLSIYSKYGQISTNSWGTYKTIHPHCLIIASTFCQWIFDFWGKKSVISDVALCVLCIRVLHGDLQVIHSDFQLFSTVHCSWRVSEYKSVLLLFKYSTKQNLSYY